MAPQARIVACDLVPIEPISGVVSVVGSFEDEITKEKLQQLLNTDKLTNELPKFDVILSDMSPSLSGNSIRDQSLMLELAMGVLAKAEELLDPVAGILLIKVFQGSELQEFVEALKASDYKYKLVKPAASKDKSKEFYIFAKKSN